MKTLTAVKRIAVGAVVACVGLGASGAEYYWNPSVYEGFIDAGVNWYNGTAGAAPGGSDTGKFGNNSITAPAEYLVKIPAGGFADRSSTFINGLPTGTKVTFDSTGTWWLKQKEPGDSWANMILRVDNADHIFNIEGINNSGADDDNFGFYFENGRISYTAADSGDALVFESGVFNNYRYPLDSGVEARHTTILTYSPHKQDSRVVLAGGSVHLRDVQVRGQGPGSEVQVTGGDHHFYSGLHIKCWNSANEGVVRVSGGKLTLESGAMWIGQNGQGAARLIVEGDGEFEHKGNAVYFPDVQGEEAYLTIRGNGYYHSSSAGIGGGHAVGSTSHLVVKDNGRLVATAVTAGENTDSTNTLTVADNGYLGAQYINAANGERSHAEVTLTDNGTIALAYNGGWFNGTDATGTFTMDGGHFIFSNGGWLSFGQNNTSVPKEYFNGGVFDNGSGGGAGGLYFMGGPGSEHLIDGAEVRLNNMVIEGRQNVADWTNVVRMAGGKLFVRCNGVGDGLDIRGNNRNAMFLMEGGEFHLGTNGSGMLRLGHAGANNGYHAVFRQTGGTVYEDCVVNMCDAGGSDGEFELLGGVFYGRDIRGWNGSAYRGNTGWARCYFNGGTLKPVRAGITLIYTMTECSVGPLGLTVDTEGTDTTISAKFQNDGAGTADEVDGLFVKKGRGTLTLRLVEKDGGAQGEYAGRSLASDHTYTEVLGGKVVFSDVTEARFGRNVKIGHSGTLSLEGAATALVVDSITIGDGAGYSTLYLDAGDRVYVTGQNGVRSLGDGGIDGTFVGTEGSYDVFVCDYEPSAAELAKIKVIDEDASKTYNWHVAQDPDTGKYVATFVIGASGGSGSTTWNGEVSSDWATAGNWTSTLPVGGGTALFPASAANKSVASAADATVGTLSFEGGSYVLSGADAVRVTRGISVAAGSTAISAPLALRRTLEANVAAGADLTVSGPLSGIDSQFVKTGSGHMLLSGDNSSYSGVVASNGGTLEVPSRAALGPASTENPLTLKGGTLLYNGEAAEAGALRIESDAYQTPVIINTAQDITFHGISHARGTFVKIGAGTLTLDLPAGSFMMGSSAGEENIGENGGVASLPASGDSPESHSGLYGVNIFEGTLRVRGQGVGATTLSTGNSAIVGGGYAGTAAAVLDIADASVNWGAGSRHGCLCRDLPAGTPAPKIILNNAYLWSDSCAIGQHSVAESFPEITMVNSTFFDHYNASIGNGSVKPVIDANNSKLYNDGDFGFNFAGSFTADFYGKDALFGSVGVNNMNNEWGNPRYPRTGAVCAWNNITGSLTFRDGAVFAVTRGIMFRNDGCITTTFDGGVFEVRPHNNAGSTISAMRNTSVQGFTTTGGGLAVNILPGVDHSITFPIRGTGGLAKKGAGTLRLVHSYDQAHFVDNEDLVDEEIPLLQHEGDTEVLEGTLVVDGGVIGSTAKFAVASGAVLDLNASAVEAASFSGAGTVANGEMAGPILVKAADDDVLSLSGVALQAKHRVVFDFGGVKPVPKSTKVIARLLDANGDPLASYNVSGWKGFTSDEGMQVYYDFSYDPATGNVTVTFKATNGFYFLLH